MIEMPTGNPVHHYGRDCFPDLVGFKGPPCTRRMAFAVTAQICFLCRPVNRRKWSENDDEHLPDSHGFGQKSPETPATNSALSDHDLSEHDVDCDILYFSGPMVSL
jgi:hypothetical protein